MKHTLNVLTLTALAAAASAQTAPASGLNYNQVGISRTSRQNAVTAQGVLGSTNFLLGLQSTSNQGSNNNEPSLTVGYIFKNVTQGIDATVFVQQPQWERTAYGVTLRRALNEVYAGLEISASYAGTLTSTGTSYIALGGSSFDARSVTAFELAYNVNKTFSVAVGLAKGNQEARQTVFSVRAGF